MKRLPALAGLVALVGSLSAPGGLLAADFTGDSLDLGDVAREGPREVGERARDTVRRVREQIAALGGDFDHGREGPDPADRPDRAAGGSEPTSTGGRQRSGTAARAASIAVDIRDFLYSPRTVTIAVGDTVTWTNFDDASHNAEAFDGSFATPVLDERESAAVTFDDPGSFRYFCVVHPPDQGWPDFTGTVTVTAPEEADDDGGPGDDGSSGTGGDEQEPPADRGTDATGSGSEPGTGQSSGTAAGDSGLPTTGLELLPLWLAGVGLLGAAALLRARSREG